MNNKGAIGVLSYFMSVAVFIIVWAFWLGGFLSDWGEQAVTLNSLVGIEAFLFMNINLFIFIGLGLGSLAVLTLGGEQ